MAAAAHAQAEEAKGADPEAEGNLSKIYRRARGEGDRTDQPYPARVGELLRGRELKPVLFVGEDLGRKEDPAPSDANSEA